MFIFRSSDSIVLGSSVETRSQFHKILFYFICWTPNLYSGFETAGSFQTAAALGPKLVFQSHCLHNRKAA